MSSVGRNQKIEINAKGGFLKSYLGYAPLALALERVLECHILSRKEFLRPVLDIGCGDGIFVDVLFKEDIDVGVDLDAAELERCKNHGKHKELILSGANQIPKPDKYFKTIFANSVLEHIPDVQGVLKEAARLLADDGKIYFTLPTEKFEQYTLGFQLLSMLKLKDLAKSFTRFFNRFWKHYHCHDRAGWSRLFEEHGLRVSDCREYDPKISCLLNDSLIPLGFFSFLSRKFFQRWFLIPPLRRLAAPLLTIVFYPWIARNIEDGQQGGLIFFELQKS